MRAPRQTGKNTALRALMAHLNRQERSRALYANIEGAQAAWNNVEQGIATACSVLACSAATWLKDDQLVDWLHERGPTIPAGDRWQQLLTKFA